MVTSKSTNLLSFSSTIFTAKCVFPFLTKELTFENGLRTPGLQDRIDSKKSTHLFSNLSCSYSGVGKKLLIFSTPAQSTDN